MAIVQFRWDQLLIDLRRETCPRATWNASRRAWIMTAADAETFLGAAQARLYFAKSSCRFSSTARDGRSVLFEVRRNAWTNPNFPLLKRARIGGPPVAVETGRAIFDSRGAAEKFS